MLTGAATRLRVATRQQGQEARRRDVVPDADLADADYTRSAGRGPGDAISSHEQGRVEVVAARRTPPPPRGVPTLRFEAGLPAGLPFCFAPFGCASWSRCGLRPLPAERRLPRCSTVGLSGGGR